MSEERGAAVRDVGFLILRLGIGLAFVIHGWPKMSGGPQRWTELGQAMGVLGVTFAPTFWGFMAASAEFFGGIALVLGLLVRPFCMLMAITMFVAAAMHLSGEKAFPEKLGEALHALEMLSVFVALLLLGPGRLTLWRLLRPILRRSGKAASKAGT